MTEQLIDGDQSLNKQINISVDRRAYLDGVRGIAILLVAVGHFFYKYDVFKSTWIGLNLFFVLSGYLITQRLYVHLKEGPGLYFKNFYFRRILRIFPLYYLCLVIFFLLLPLVYGSYFEFYGQLFQIQGWYWAYASNWLMINHGLPGQPVFFHFWSLAVEEQFYLLWPVIFLLIARSRISYWVILILIVASIILRNYIGVGLDCYLNTGTVAEALLMGAMIAVLEENKLIEQLKKYFIGLSLIAILTLFFIYFKNPEPEIVLNEWLMRVGYSAVDYLWAFILFICASSHQLGFFLKKPLSVNWLTLLGKYSYGIYVYHWIFLNMFIYKAETELLSTGINPTIVFFSIRVIGMAIVLIVSYLSFHIYEKRFLRLKKYFA